MHSAYGSQQRDGVNRPSSALASVWCSGLGSHCGKALKRHCKTALTSSISTGGITDNKGEPVTRSEGEFESGVCA